MEELRPQTTLFCAVLALAIALSMLLRGRRLAHWLFAAFATDIAFWYASQSLYGLFQNPIWVRVTGVLTVLLPQLALRCFQAILPDENPRASSKLVGIGTALGFPVLAIVLSPYHEAPLSLGATYLYVFGLLAAALISLAKRGKKSTSRATRDRVRYLVGVGALATTFTLADFLSFLGVHLPPIGAVLSIVFLFALAESLTRSRLADIYEVSGRLLVATAVAFCLAGVFYIFVSVLGRFSTMYLNAVLAAIVFLVLFEPLRDQVQARIHRYFLVDRHALDTAVADLRRRLAHVMQIDEMVELVLSGLDQSRRLTTCAIFLRDEDGHGFDRAGSVGNSVPLRIEALSARPLLERLQKVGSLSLEELAREPTKGDAVVLAAAGVLGALSSSVVCGIRGEHDELVGLLAISDERVKDAFSPEEVAILETVATQIGVAVANSKVYSRMKVQDRLAELGAMAAGLAHEVKNPLGAIKGAAQLLEELGELGMQADPSWKEFVGIILEEVGRLDRVVGSFLDYARPNTGNPIPVDINAAVRRTVQILASQGLDEIAFRLELSEENPKARIDPEKLRQVLFNLVQNAIQAMNGQGEVLVATNYRRSARNGWAGAPVPEKTRRSDDYDRVEIAVRDTGPGISQKVLKNLFIPFFTTKERGTGLGLALSQSIVQSASGTINVHTQDGSGTTFTIVLPVATDVMV